MKLKKIYHHYNLWEDWKAGLYDLEKEYDEYALEECSNYCKELLSNPLEFYIIGKEMIDNWKYSSEVNLSNKNRNRQAWIGQATCCYKYGVPERITKIAWNMLTWIEQDEANKIADKLILYWEAEYGKKLFK
jgi:hypothetical protein